MSTAEQSTDINQTEDDVDLSMFEGFDVPSFIRNHNGIPDVATSKQESVRNRLRAIQRRVIENDPGVQQILVGIIHARSAAVSNEPPPQGDPFKSAALEAYRSGQDFSPSIYGVHD